MNNTNPDKLQSVAEVEFSVWDGVGTSNSFWIDDFVVSQA
jgi:hypothetical protein